jgi:hypothetical protein
MTLTFSAQASGATLDDAPQPNVAINAVAVTVIDSFDFMGGLVAE